MSSVLHFSPLDDDVVVVSSRIPSRADPYILSFCDLEASTSQGKFIVTSEGTCGRRPPESVLWRPEGSMCRLNIDSAVNAFFTTDQATNKRVVDVPVENKVIPVFNTGNMKSKPTICVPCTWAAPSPSTRKSCLIASTSHQHPVNDKGSKDSK
ncbi:hypothetical protein Pelo_18964 [Pelomyxa schiedti]|nr:hypothetical protein Pelo_18964 [Pelomyxa schiedti]